MASEKKESILYQYLIKTDNKDKLIANIIFLFGGTLWLIWIIIDFNNIFNIMINQYTWYNINPLPRIIAITIIPSIIILIGLLGINDYYNRKN